MKRFLFLALFLTVVLGTVVFSGDITPNGMNQGDLYTFLSNIVAGGNSIKTEFNLAQAQMYNKPLDSPGISSITAGAIQTTGFEYTIDGIVYTQASASLTPASTSTSVTVGKFNLFLLSIDAAGNASASAGTEGSTAAAIVWPSVPTGYAPFGYILVKSKAAATFTYGLDDWGKDADICTFYNLISIASDSGGGVSALSFSDLSLTGL